MPKFPDPDPRRIRGSQLDTFEVEEGQLWWRIYFASGPYPTEWNRFRNFGPVSTARFDHHLEPPAIQRRQVLYAAESIGVCLAEVFQDRRRIGFDGDPHLAGFHVVRPLLTLNLRQLWPTRVGASQAISSGPRARSRMWARAVASSFDEVDGLLYSSSMHAGDAALALWDCQDALAALPMVHLRLNDPSLRPALLRLAASIGYTVAV